MFVVVRGAVTDRNALSKKLELYFFGICVLEVLQIVCGMKLG